MYPNWKERSKISFSDDMILNRENPKYSTIKLLYIIHKFSKVAGYKINIQKYVAFLHNGNKISEREIKKTMSFTTATKRIKYLGKNLPKDTKTDRKSTRLNSSH